MDLEGESPPLGGTWQILRPLARGGMGAVYVARHRVTEELVALKVLYDRDPDPSSATHERFLREARASAEIQHPGLATVLDAGVEPDGTRYIVMELLEGDSLRDRIRKGLSRREGLALLVDLLEPLAAAHAMGFIHRDLKPQNAFVVRDETGRERVKLLDFGISRRPGVQTVTDFATAMGTPHYTSPEQIRDARCVSTAADVWSAGVLLYQMLTSRFPFDGDRVQTTMRARDEPHVPVLDLVVGIDARLAALVDRCLAKAPGDRPPHAEALRAELAALLADPSLALPEGAATAAPSGTFPIPTLPTDETTKPRPEEVAPQPPVPAMPAPSEVGPPAPQLSRRRILIAAIAAAVLGGATVVAIAVSRPARRVPARSVAAAQAVRAPQLSSSAPAPAPAPVSAPDDEAPPDDNTPVSHTVLEEIVLGPATAEPVPDSRAERRMGALRACLPVLDAVHARCFLRVSLGRARGELELRNLLVAYYLTGDVQRSSRLAARYLESYPRSRYAAQVRQIALVAGPGGAGRSR